jgi:hypothetical protein
MREKRARAAVSFWAWVKREGAGSGAFSAALASDAGEGAVCRARFSRRSAIRKEISGGVNGLLTNSTTEGRARKRPRRSSLLADMRTMGTPLVFSSWARALATSRPFMSGRT